MTMITSEHDQGGFPKDVPPTPPNPGKSRYCYLFPDAARQYDAGIFADAFGDEQQTIYRLLAVATWLEQQNSARPPNDPLLRMPVPAVYTYFGQFVNHDLSAPVGGMLADVNAIPDAATIGNEPLFAGKTWRGSVEDILLHFQNEHEHPLTLGSLYGEGPYGVAGKPPSAEIRALYDAEGVRFRLGQTCDASADFARLTVQPDQVVQKPGPDLPRQTDPDRPAMALIADRRNDENLILSQLHLAMMLLHNKAVDALRPQFDDPATCFAQARRLVTRHYHWCILHDLLPQLLSPSVLRTLDLTAPARLTLRQVPLEFTTAAFRFGHSMVADSYDYNANFGTEKIVSPRASLIQLFSFTTHGGMGGLGAYSALPDHWVVDWQRLTDPNPQGLAQSDRIDLAFAQMMMKVAQGHGGDGIGSIIARNLARGFHRRIPFGQVLAQAYGVAVLTPDEIRATMPRGLDSDPQHPETLEDAQKRQAFLTETPAWLYFLCEAKAREGGTRLGATASHIIAETFVGLLQQDADSILGAQGRGWAPAQSPLQTADRRPIGTIRDLLLFAVAAPL